MVYLPTEVFNKVVNYCGDTPINKHRKIMTELIKDIDLFLDLYATILKDKIDLSRTGVIDIHFNRRKTSPKTFELFIEYHEYDTEEFDYDFVKINSFIFANGLIYREV